MQMSAASSTVPSAGLTAAGQEQLAVDLMSLWKTICGHLNTWQTTICGKTFLVLAEPDLATVIRPSLGRGRQTQDEDAPVMADSHLSRPPSCVWHTFLARLSSALSAKSLSWNLSCCSWRTRETKSLTRASVCFRFPCCPSPPGADFLFLEAFPPLAAEDSEEAEEEAEVRLPPRGVAEEKSMPPGWETSGPCPSGGTGWKLSMLTPDAWAWLAPGSP